MTDTPSSGAGADARVHGDPVAIAALSIAHVDHAISSAEADGIFTAAEPAPPAPDVVIDASVLKPSLTALVRWAATLFAMWLVQRGFVAKGLADQLVPILGGLMLAAGTLAWSLIQKRLAGQRIVVAAKADPAKVVLR